MEVCRRLLMSHTMTPKAIQDLTLPVRPFWWPKMVVSCLESGAASNPGATGKTPQNIDGIKFRELCGFVLFSFFRNLKDCTRQFTIQKPYMGKVQSREVAAAVLCHHTRSWYQPCNYEVAFIPNGSWGKFPWFMRATHLFQATVVLGFLVQHLTDKKSPSSPWPVEYVGVSKSRGTPKWMVYNGKPY